MLEWPTMSTITTDATLRQLAERDEIARLLARLGVILDEGRFDELPALLADGVTARTPGGTAEGRDAVVAQARRNHAPEQPIQHAISNLLIDVDEEGADVRANLLAVFGEIATGPVEEPVAPPVEYATGQVVHYHLVRTAGGWRISRIETTPVWRWGMPPRPVPAC
jgi:hypothetical protein